MLYPKESVTRQVKDLCDIWNFKADFNNEGYKKKWFLKELKNPVLMPVPCSYNDITQDPRIRDHIGDVWYQRKFFVPDSWSDKIAFIRVGSATHFACVFLNGKKIVEHKGGFLPFEAQVSDYLKYGKENVITICVNNILDWSSIPPGNIEKLNDDMHPKNYTRQVYHFDFFNYSGIHRPVKIYTVPQNYISDVKVNTKIMGKKGIIDYVVDINGKGNVKVKLEDKSKRIVAESSGKRGKLYVTDPKLWEPGNPYLYNLIIEIFNRSDKLLDSYNLNIGIRTVKIKGKKLLINNKPFYFKGFGKHEDSDIRGKGHDDTVNIKDFNLLKWIGANSFRTSHYPYSEEIMDLADKYGFVVIDEVPAVGMNFFNNENIKVFSKNRVNRKTLQNHIKSIKELIQRDKNHPSVIMWSLANEAATHEKESFPYFKKVYEFTKKMDETRPITIVNNSAPQDCKVAQIFDVVCFNRYYSWYSDPGSLEVIELQLERELKKWHQLFKKPVIITEYGADSIAGFHQDPPIMFTEEYQCELLKKYHKIFDKLDFVIGEHVWNFADFATKQGTTRVMGNKKGVFTRQRQPKAAAHLLKERWTKKN